MKNLHKAARMAATAFRNALRLHRDSILLYRNGSYPSAYQLSVLSQEEIGKAFLLEDHVWQTGVNRGGIVTSDDEKLLAKDLITHGAKQRWFSRQVDDFVTRKGNFTQPSFMKEVASGVLNEEKQNATYVGLTKKGRKLNLEGKIIDPVTKTKSKKAKRHITRVNDFIIILAEGSLRGTLSVDTEELENELTLGLVNQLERLWKDKTPQTRKKLRDIREMPLEHR